MKNKIIKIIIFIFIFCILFWLTFKILWLEKNPITYFYEEPKNSLDIAYIGGSNVYAHFNSTLAYNEYGFTTGFMSYDSQPIIAAKYLIEEVKKYQNPKLYIIDLSKVADSFSNVSEAGIRKVTDSLKNSKNRNALIDDMLKYTGVPKEGYINYYFSILKYHDVWKDPGKIKMNLLGNKNLYKGYLFLEATSLVEPQKEYEWSNEIKEMPKKNKEVVLDLLEYIKKNNIEVLFVVSKRVYDSNTIMMMNDAIKLIKDNGYKVINFNTLEDFKVDFNNDFYNFAHLNVYGATKYTLYFSRYLNEHYNFPNHKNDKKYEKWNKEYNRFKNSFNNLTGENFAHLLNEYRKLGY